METSKVYQLLAGQITLAKEEEGLKIYYVLPQEEREDPERGFRVFCIGQPSDRPTRCVLLLGETGSGKTTIINAAINHLFGVRFEDPFRLQVKDVTGDDRPETESQTDLITAYNIYYKEGMKHEYNYVLIDTPGLADTRGAQQQHVTGCRLDAFLTSDFGVDALHCVGLVANATRNRNLESEKAVLREITSLLGNTVPEITHIFTTFAVDKPLFAAVVQNAGVDFKRMFEFDNGIHFTPAIPNTCSERQRADNTNMSYRWHRMSEQYEIFFGALVNTSFVTLKILREKKHFDTCKKYLKEQIEKHVISATKVEIDKKTYSQYEQQKANNKDWLQEETVEKTFTVDLGDGLYPLDCNLCKQTCMIFKYEYGKASEPKKSWFYEGIGTLTTLLSAIPGRKSVQTIFQIIRANIGTFGAGIAVGALVVGTISIGIYCINGGKNKNLELSDIVGDENTVCGKNGCDHTIKEHTIKKKNTVEKTEVQEKTDENKKKLYDEAVSKMEDAYTKIVNGQQEILSCSTNISSCTIKLLNHAKRIQMLTSQDFDYIEDVSSQLNNEIRLAEDIIPRARKYVNILTEAMRQLESYTPEEVLDLHEFLKEMLLRSHEELLNITQKTDTNENE